MKYHQFTYYYCFSFVNLHFALKNNMKYFLKNFLKLCGAETENMKRRRFAGHYRKSAKDEYSEELFGAESVPDDDGMPFEPNRGMRGIPKIPRKNRAAWFGVQNVNYLYQGAPPQQQQGNNRFAMNTGDYERPTMPPIPSRRNNIHQVPVSPPINSNDNNNENVAQPQKKSSFASKYRGAYRKAGEK